MWPAGVHQELSMLILSRRTNDSVTVKFGGVQITVKIVRVEGDVVKLGLEGPSEVGFWRTELLDESGNPKPGRKSP